MIVEVTEEEFLEHVDENDGVCSHCGEWSFGGCEPDARNYLCESCGKQKVFGAEEALMIGVVDIMG